VVQLEGEFLAGLDGDPLDLVEGGVLQDSIGSPGTVHLTVEFGHLRILFLEPADQLFHLLSLGSVADKQRIDSVNDDEVMNTDETDMFSRCMNIIIACGKELRLPDITFRVVLFDLVECLECPEIAPCGLQGNDGNIIDGFVHKSQANDAYWHGLFGGLYLPHLRRAVWSNLIELEAALDAKLPRAPLERGDIDHDGHDEILLHNAHLQIALRLDGNGAIHELDSYALRQNFCDTLMRRREHYYTKFDVDPDRDSSRAGIASAHDRVSFKHEITAADLFSDTKPRASLLDCWQPRDERHCAHVETYSLTSASAPLRALELSSPVASGRIIKRVNLEGRKIEVAWRLEGLPAGYFMTRLNLAMPSCDGFSGRYILEDGTIPHGFGEHFVLESCRELTLDDRALGGGIVLRATPPASICATPYHTVSLSEAGFEKIMQAASPTVMWSVGPGPVEIRLELEMRGPD